MTSVIMYCDPSMYTKHHGGLLHQEVAGGLTIIGISGLHFEFPYFRTFKCAMLGYCTEYIHANS